jgi:hypothetical protein
LFILHVAWAKIIPDLREFLQRAHLTVQSRVSGEQKWPRDTRSADETYLGSGEHEDRVPLLPVRELAGRRLRGST